MAVPHCRAERAIFVFGRGKGGQIQFMKSDQTLNFESFGIFCSSVDVGIGTTDGSSLSRFVDRSN